MPDGDLNNETIKVYCCCIRKTVHKVPPCTKTVYSQLQESLKVPYSGDVPKDLTAGSAICITGSMKPKCTRFSVDLICKKGTSRDIALHFNPRLDRNYIVRNSLVSEKWGVEEAASTTKCDLIRNEKFEIIFLVTNDAFMISVNGKHFCAFKFRISLSLITNIEILGDVDISRVEYNKWSRYPEVKPDVPSFAIDVEREEEPAEESLAIPCTAHLQKGFQEGWQLEIYGRVKLLPHSFFINLQEGSQKWPHPVIPLHLNPRFKSIASENVIIRNAWIDGHWGPEERSPGVVFTPGEQFCMAIRKTHDCFSVWVNGQLIGEFKFRTTENMIDTLYIEGDVLLKKIIARNKFGDLTKPSQKVNKL